MVSFSGYVEVTFYLPGAGNIGYAGFQSGSKAESMVQDLRADIQKGKAAVKNITASINPIIKKYMKDRNIRILFDYCSFLCALCGRSFFKISQFQRLLQG
jgi:hypothetical protein